jgi:membrane associated rhomboid family serine protease
MAMREEEEYAAVEWQLIPPEPGDWEAFGLLSERRVRRWALVLEARGFPYRIEHSGIGWRLLTPSQRFTEAREELRLYEEENRNWPPPPPPPAPLEENTLTTLSVLVLVAAFYNVTRFDFPVFGRAVPDWVALGSAHAALIREGQWWRLITPLTLHADVEHLLSNVILGGGFIVLLCRELGSGLGWSLLLASGILGNLANSYVQSPDHRSIGASTLVFGAVGILAAFSFIRYRHHQRRRWPLPIAASLALLALLGTEGVHTDLGAHLFGFLFGIGPGVAAALLLERFGRPGRLLNFLLSLACILTVGAAWWAALAHGKAI